MTDFNEMILDELERLLSMTKSHLAQANEWGEADRIAALYRRHSAIENAINDIILKDLQEFY
tara:strand:+ start:228 stop:413 length:186 start_codon:yes stop_codon:yes gene_type:complete